MQQTRVVLPRPMRMARAPEPRNRDADISSLNAVMASRPLTPPPIRLAERVTTAAQREAVRYAQSAQARHSRTDGGDEDGQDTLSIVEAA